MIGRHVKSKYPGNNYTGEVVACNLTANACHLLILQDGGLLTHVQADWVVVVKDYYSPALADEEMPMPPPTAPSPPTDKRSDSPSLLRKKKT
jgi:hypothetical protein